MDVGNCDADRKDSIFASHESEVNVHDGLTPAIDELDPHGRRAAPFLATGDR